MEKVAKIPSRSNSPQKSGRKSDQRVQFVETSELNLHGHKVYGKPPEAPRYTRGGSRLLGSSSTSNISSNNSSRSSSGGGSQVNLDRSKSDSLNWTSSLDRKRPGSFDKSKGLAEKTNRTLDPKRTQSLDRRRAAEKNRQENSGVSNSNLDRKRRDCENKDGQSREKKPKVRSDGSYRSHSGERTKISSRLKISPSSVNQNESSKSDSSSSINLKSHHNENIRSVSKSNKLSGEWAFRVRAVSRSPHRRMNKSESSEDKENNEKSTNNKENKSKHGELSKSYDARERGRSLKREHRSGKLSSSRSTKM